MHNIIAPVFYTALDVATKVCTIVPMPLGLVQAVYFGVFLTALVSPLMLPALVARLIIKD